MFTMDRIAQSRFGSLRHYSLALLATLTLVIPQWSGAQQAVDCNDPDAACVPEPAGQVETVKPNHTFEQITVLRKAEKSPIPTPPVIVGTPN